MPDPHLFIRLDLTEEDQIGPGKIALLEAIQTSGSISGAARALGMSYRQAWLLIAQVNQAVRKPAVITAHGGRSGGGAEVTDVGEEIVRAYRAMEKKIRIAAAAEVRAIRKLARTRSRTR